VCNHRDELNLRDYQLAGLIHELKSPLAAIQSALDILKGPTTVGTTAFRVDYLRMIDRNANRLEGCIDTVLETISLRDRQNELAKQPTDIVGLCSQAAAEFIPVASNKGLHLRLEERPSESVYVSCDREKVGLVLSNLLSNAIKFTSQGRVSIQARAKANVVEVCVEDSGIGIPGEELPYVFDRFFRGESYVMTKGLGLGLSIAKFWVNAHGGKIGAASAGKGFGSRFWFELPKLPQVV
jgi:signal transduction histidine kinase